MAGIIKYETLKAYKKVLADVDKRDLLGHPLEFLEDLHDIVDSHMRLQCRNSKLRVRNSRLIAIVSTVRGAINGKHK